MAAMWDRGGKSKANSPKPSSEIESGVLTLYFSTGIPGILLGLALVLPTFGPVLIGRGLARLLVLSRILATDLAGVARILSLSAALGGIFPMTRGRRGQQANRQNAACDQDSSVHVEGLFVRVKTTHQMEPVG